MAVVVYCLSAVVKCFGSDSNHTLQSEGGSPSELPEAMLDVGSTVVVPMWL